MSGDDQKIKSIPHDIVVIKNKIHLYPIEGKLLRNNKHYLQKINGRIVARIPLNRVVFINVKNIKD